MSASLVSVCAIPFVVSGVVAMISARKTSHVTSRVLLTFPHAVRILTQSRGAAVQVQKQLGLGLPFALAMYAAKSGLHQDEGVSQQQPSVKHLLTRFRTSVCRGGRRAKAVLHVDNLFQPEAVEFRVLAG